MTRVIVDPQTQARLRDLAQPAELCDESGQVFGYFTPLSSRVPAEAREPVISEEELRRREQEGGGRTLAEILADLEKKA
jgi:hypothetical protein